MNISPTNAIHALPGLAEKSSPAAGSETGFGKFLAQQLSEINQTQLDADKLIADLATGQTDDVHNVVVSMAKADLSFRLVLEIRNRLIESYQEIMRMQV